MLEGTHASFSQTYTPHTVHHAFLSFVANGKSRILMTTGNKFPAAGDKKKKKKKKQVVLETLAGTPYSSDFFWKQRGVPLGYHHPTSPAMKNLKGYKIYCLVAALFKSLGMGHQICVNKNLSKERAHASG